MGITSLLKVILKTCRAISHEAKECVLELWITIRFAGQPWRDKNVLDSIIKKFDFILRGRGVKTQGFGYRDSLQRTRGVRRNPGWEIRYFHIIPSGVGDKELDRNFAGVAGP